MTRAGNRIGELRQARGWSRRRLAERVRGTSGEQMRKLEAGERRLTADWMARLARAFGVPAGALIGAPGLAEPECRFVAESDVSETELRLARLLYPGRHADTMIVQAGALELRGYQPGDRILVDLERAPRDGDPVVAQLYDDAAAAAETVLRIYRPPLLLAHSTDMRYEPLVLGDDHVAVMGVVVARYASLALEEKI